jgi:hypothetical protein
MEQAFANEEVTKEALKANVERRIFTDTPVFASNADRPDRTRKLAQILPPSVGFCRLLSPSVAWRHGGRHRARNEENREKL